MPALEMEGLLKLQNTSRSTCALDHLANVRLSPSAGAPALSMPSAERDFGQYPYETPGPFAPGAVAVTPIFWEASWCGPDPGTSPTLVATLPHGDGTIRTTVVLTHPQYGHVPSCTAKLPRGGLVFAPLAQ